MPRIIPVDWKTLVRVFELYGCEYKRKKGSHHILICPGAKRAVVIPEYSKKPRSKLRGIEKQSSKDLVGVGLHATISCRVLLHPK